MLSPFSVRPRSRMPQVHILFTPFGLMPSHVQLTNRMFLHPSSTMFAPFQKITFRTSRSSTLLTMISKYLYFLFPPSTTQLLWLSAAVSASVSSVSPSPAAPGMPIPAPPPVPLPAISHAAAIPASMWFSWAAVRVLPSIKFCFV